ncbi:AAA family ATPase [Sporolactobacillus vineae]|uniref:AAA family ATPase n=1 Tax=Sporolactobacillus vineae TaxID=444463 RepID=UPI0009DA053D
MLDDRRNGSDESRIEFVQFHQNYSYEDFMMGYKPVNDGFELKYGIFYRFCQKAANQPDKDFFFIIDEINRGNMSKIFGELLMLIERDYRGTKTTLAYNGLDKPSSSQLNWRRLTAKEGEAPVAGGH